MTSENLQQTANFSFTLKSPDVTIQSDDNKISSDQYAAISRILNSSIQPEIDPSFQQRVHTWMNTCFGSEITADRIERNHRFFEESTELVQANGMTRSEAHQLVDYTFDRPVGELHQEVGGVMVTLAALCLASGVDMDASGETELERIWLKVEEIRKKQAAKPKHSPLPIAQPNIRAIAVQIELVPDYDPRLMYLENEQGSFDVRVSGLSVRQIKDIFEQQFGALVWSEATAYPADAVKLQFIRADLSSTTPEKLCGDHSQ